MMWRGSGTVALLALAVFSESTTAVVPATSPKAQ